MRSRLSILSLLLDSAFVSVKENVAGLRLEEALFVPSGGYRSILGTLKHVAAWSHVYYSFAFDDAPRGWQAVAWPHHLRETIIKSQVYVDDVIVWMDVAHQQWQNALAKTAEEQIDELHRLHWGDSAPLFDIILRVANHCYYHAGEINQLRSIFKGEAWEEGEEVEENNISSIGHRVVPPWKVNARQNEHTPQTADCSEEG